MTVVVVGPASIVGPGNVDAELVSSALECIDEPLGLLDGTVVPAERIWRDAMAAAIGTAPAVTVVCPTWWSTSRVARIRAAAHVSTSHVMVRHRTEALREAADEPDCAVIELGEDLVTVSRPAAASTVVRRADGAVADAVVAHAAVDTHVVIDAPIGVPGAAPLAAEIQARLRDQDVTAQIVSCDDLCGHDADSAPVAAGPGFPRGRIAMAAAAVIAIAGAVTLGLFSRDGPAAAVVTAADPDVTWLVEGRVAVQIPARWTVERTLSGTGSARVQIISPDDRSQIIHLTQSLVPPGQTLDAAARSLREAAAKLPDGLIEAFEDAGVSAGRSAIRYREVRGGRTVEWSVLLDGPVRIAVGCQGASVRSACDAAIRSARRTD